jgi:tetratricopeptide (TPR) repeat protein
MSRLLFGLALMLAATLPASADDMDSCRDRQTEAKARLDACEKAIAGGKIAGKDLGIAQSVRGNALLAKRDNDKAIAAFGAAHDADPDNTGYLISRGVGYEDKGDDDHAMADYNLVLQMRPNTALALNNRGTLYLRKGAFQSALDDFNAALKIAPKLYLAHTNRGRVLTVNKDFDGALADFAEAEQIDPAPPQARSYR